MILDITKYGNDSIRILDAEQFNDVLFHFGYADGTILESYANVGLVTELSFEIIPEPSTAVLIFLGLGIITYRQRLG